MMRKAKIAMVLCWLLCALMTAYCKARNPAWCESNQDCANPDFRWCDPYTHGCVRLPLESDGGEEPISPQDEHLAIDDGGTGDEDLESTEEDQVSGDEDEELEDEDQVSEDGA